MSLQVKAVSGVKWTTLSTVVVALLHIIQLMVFARYLSATDFGLIAILTIIVNFSQLFVDFGLSKAIIYKKNITSSQLSTLYWMNVFLGIGTYIVIVVSSGFIADFYHKPELKIYIIIVSSIMIIQAFGQQFRTLFQKELKFAEISKIDMLAASCSFIIAVFLAVLGYGIYAFIISTIFMVVLKTLLLFIKGMNYHKPQFFFNFRDAKFFLIYGSYIVGDGIVNTIASGIDIILIGKLFGTEVLGGYSLVKELILRPAQIINPIITKVAFPAMATINTNEKRFNAVYLKLITFTSSVNFPIYFVALILAKEIIIIFLGSKWLDFVEIFQILAIWALFRSIGNPVGVLLMAKGKPQVGMYWNMFMLFYMPLMVFIASTWGIIGISWGNVLTVIWLFTPGWYYLIYKVSYISFQEYVLSFLPPLAISMFIAFIILMILKIISTAIIMYNIIITLLVGTMLLIISYKKFNKIFFDEFVNIVTKK